MRIESVRIENFRAFHDQTIRFNKYTCLAGPNGGGKSTILTALNTFFRYSLDVSSNIGQLENEDFHNKDTSLPASITVTFTDLSPEAQADFSAYFRQGKLIITASAEWNPSTGRAEVKQFGQRLAMKEFAPFFKLEGNKATVAELKKEYQKIRSQYKDLPAPGTKEAMIDALHEYESSHSEECQLIQSEDQFYGITKGKNLLERCIQWIFVPAVKDASTEQVEARKTALGRILERTVRSKVSFAEPLAEIRSRAISDYGEMLLKREELLGDLSASLTSKLQEWAHPDATVRLRWRTDAEGAVRLADPLAEVLTADGVFEGQLSRFGHGLQRSFLITLLQELANAEENQAPTLLLACEEPELFQHPPQIRHLASVFQKLTDSGAQVVVCTHSPLFVRGHEFQDVRLVRRDPTTSDAIVRSVTFDEIADEIALAKGEKPLPPEGSAMKIGQALQPTINEMFFTPILILVEGLEDVAYISSYMVLLNQWEEFRRLGCHIVPAGGKSSMIQPLTVARALAIPTFVMFDLDTDKCKKDEIRKQHERDNRTIFSLTGVDGTKALPDSTVWSESLVAWHEDIGSVLEQDIGKDKWIDLRQRVQTEQGVSAVGDLEKNGTFIGCVLAKAWDDGMTFPSLERLCTSLLQFARAQGSRSRTKEGNILEKIIAENQEESTPTLKLS